MTQPAWRSTARSADTTAHIEQGRLAHVTVGGFTTVVAKGTITLPGT